MIVVDQPFAQSGQQAGKVIEAMAIVTANGPIEDNRNPACIGFIVDRRQEDLPLPEDFQRGLHNSRGVAGEAKVTAIANGTAWSGFKSGLDGQGGHNYFANTAMTMESEKFGIPYKRRKFLTHTKRRKDVAHQGNGEGD